MTAEPGAWTVEHRAGSAAALHALDVPEHAGRVARVLDVVAPALVLGSTQRDEVVDRARAGVAGVAVARRRSGGSAVLLVPGEHVWVDFFVPAGDPLWDDDVVAAAGWAGDAWRSALVSVGHRELGVHRGSMVAAPWSDLVCFAGRGPAEVLAGDRKLVGVSQRRTRGWTRIQTAVHLVWSPAATLDVLALDDAARRRGAEELASVVATATGAAAGLVDALVDALP